MSFEHCEIEFRWNLVVSKERRKGEHGRGYLCSWTFHICVLQSRLLCTAYGIHILWNANAKYAEEWNCVCTNESNKNKINKWQASSGIKLLHTHRERHTHRDTDTVIHSCYLAHRPPSPPTSPAAVTQRPQCELTIMCAKNLFFAAELLYNTIPSKYLLAIWYLCAWALFVCVWTLLFCS